MHSFCTVHINPLLSKHSFVQVRMASERLVKMPFLTNLSMVSTSLGANPQVTIVFVMLYTSYYSYRLVKMNKLSDLYKSLRLLKTIETIQMASDYQNRINVSVSIRCMDDIDAVIAESGLFNGRSEFIFSAIRDFFANCTRRFDNVLAEIQQEESDSGVYSRFIEAMLDYGSIQFESYSKYYPGPNVKQIPIRLEEPFYINLDNLSKYLFRADDSDRVLKTCRIAIYRYAGNVRSIVNDYEQFDSDLNALRTSSKSRKIHISD